MVFTEYLPSLSNFSDYVLSLDFASLSDWTPRLEFSPFQLDILKLFSAFLCVISALIVFFWLRYGDVISERFIRPSELPPG